MAGHGPTRADRRGSLPLDLCNDALSRNAEGEMNQQFGIAFDVRDLEEPETLEEAEAYVRRWATFQGVEIPDGLEPAVYMHDSDPLTPGSHPSIQVSFEWEGGS
jgi:hypothetical protein